VYGHAALIFSPNLVVFLFPNMFLRMISVQAFLEQLKLAQAEPVISRAIFFPQPNFPPFLVRLSFLLLTASCLTFPFNGKPFIGTSPSLSFAHTKVSFFLSVQCWPSISGAMCSYFFPHTLIFWRFKKFTDFSLFRDSRSLPDFLFSPCVSFWMFPAHMHPFDSFIFGAQETPKTLELLCPLTVIWLPIFIHLFFIDCRRG